MRILVVEDEQAIAAFVVQGLTEAGYAVDLANDAAECLYWTEIAEYDLVLLDLMLPDQDGLETTVVLRRESPDVKIIVITGGSDMIGILNYLDVAKMLGAHSTLQKPFEMKTLLETIQAELQDRPHAAYSLRAQES